MQTMDDALFALVESGRITATAAMRKATERGNFAAQAKKEEQAATLQAQHQQLN